jgi:hypothetical protein
LWSIIDGRKKREKSPIEKWAEISLTAASPTRAIFPAKRERGEELRISDTSF